MIDVSALKKIISRYEEKQMALLPVLHYMQDEEGFIDKGLHMLLADLFNITLAELKGVISFYHDFRDSPSHSRQLRLCRAEACQANGSEALAEIAKELIKGTDIELGEVYCLGLCASGPAVEVDGKIFARVTSERLISLIKEETAL